MENNEKKNHSLIDLMDASMSKIREMVDSNTIIGEPIQTPDGVTLIPVSRLSFGFGCGGGDYGKQTPAMFGGASTAGVKVEPVAFLVVKDGVTRVLPVGVPAVTTAAAWWRWSRRSWTGWSALSTREKRKKRASDGIE